MSDSIQQLGEDINKPSTESPMTLERMTDIWARLTPEQRHFMVVMFETGECEGSKEDIGFLNYCIGRSINDMAKRFDSAVFPFKFGVYQHRPAKKIQEAV